MLKKKSLSFICFFLFFFLVHGAFASYEETILSYLPKKFASDFSYHSGIQGIDKIYVINLDEHEARWNIIEEALKKNNIQAERFSAVNGWHMNSRKLTQFRFMCLETKLNPGRIGVFLSHLSIIRRALDEGYKVIWILEDDVVFNEGAISSMERILQELNSLDDSWDVLYTDNGSRMLIPGRHLEYYTFEKEAPYLLNRVTQQEFKPLIGNEIFQIEHRLGAYSMILSQRGLQKIWDYFSEHKMQYAYDIDIHFIKNKKYFQTTQDLVTTYGTFGSSTVDWYRWSK